MKRIEVLIAITSLQYGGAETQALHWASNLRRIGIPVCVVAILPGPLESKLREEGIHFYILSKRRKGKFERYLVFVRSCMSLYQLLRRIRPKRIITFLYSESLLISILKILFRGDFSLYMGRRANFGYGGRGFLQSGILRMGYRRAEAVFTNSPTNLSSAIEDGVELSRVKIIENFLREDIFEVKQRSAIKRRANVAVKCLSVGSLTPVKNHSVAIEAVKIWEENPNERELSLDIYGEGRLRIELQNQIGNSRAISLLGDSDNPWLEVEKYDIFVHMSKTEGSSNALWEAAACGLPIICTPVGDYQELMNLAQDSMFIASNLDELLSAIAEVVSNLDLIESKAQENAKAVRNSKNPERISQEIIRILGL